MTTRLATNLVGLLFPEKNEQTNSDSGSRLIAMRVGVGVRADLGFRLCKALFTNEVNIAQPNRPSRFFYAHRNHYG